MLYRKKWRTGLALHTNENEKTTLALLLSMPIQLIMEGKSVGAEHVAYHWCSYRSDEIKKRTLADTHGERDYVDTSAQKLKSSTRKRKREITRETGTVNNVQWMGTVRCWASFQLKHSRRAVCLWDHLCAHCKFCSGPAPFSDVKTNQPGKSDKITSRTLSLTWPECFNDLCVFLDSNEVATNKTETEPKPKQNRK